MIIEAKLEISDQTIAADFGVIHVASDGSFDRGYEEGEKAGYTNGYKAGTKEGAQVGYKAGYEKANAENPLYYMTVQYFQWQGKAFPEGFNFVLRLRDKPGDMNAMLSGTTGIKTATISCDAEGVVNMGQLVRDSTVEIVDLTNFKPTPSSFSYFAYTNRKLVSILGAIDMSNCSAAVHPFAGATALRDVEFVPSTIKISTPFGENPNLTNASIQSIIDGLADLTGQTAQTLTLANVAGKKLTDEQKATITAKNWTLVY